MASGRQSAFSTFGIEAATLAGLTWVMVAGAIVIFVGVAILMTVALRSRGGTLSHRGGMRLILWVGGVVPTIVLFALLVATLPQMRPIRARRPAYRGAGRTILVAGRLSPARPAGTDHRQ